MNFRDSGEMIPVQNNLNIMYYVCIAVAASAVTQAADKRQLMQHHQDIPLSRTPGQLAGTGGQL